MMVLYGRGLESESTKSEKKWKKFLTGLFHYDIITEWFGNKAESLTLTGRHNGATYERMSIMALKRQKNNIVNLALMVVTADEKAGMSIDQTILNGKSATVSVRLLNGGRKSAAIKLDRAALTDLQEALTEILETEGDF